MKISIYQIKRKDKDGNLGIYLVFVQSKMRTLINTGLKSRLPLIKQSGNGVGFAFDKKEPLGKVKQKRLEHLFWSVEEYCTEHPGIRPEPLKNVVNTFINGFGVSENGKLAETFDAYLVEGNIGKSTATIMNRTKEKIIEFDKAAGFEIDRDWLDKFSKHLASQGAKVNGIGLHLRNIRTIFNFARRKRLTKEYPFLDYKIKMERQVIKAMSLDQLRKLRDYPCQPWQVEYRDLFMLSFYLAGINMGDLFKCRKLTNGRLIYTRAKTDKPLSLPVYPEATKLIKKYKGEKFLINPCDRYEDYRGYLHRMNDGLKKIGEVSIIKDKVGKMRKQKIVPVFNGLTTYVARYTFASIAAECGVQRDIIAACLGHSWADVTSHYIAYSQKQIDDAIRKVIDYVNSDLSTRGKQP